MTRFATLRAMTNFAKSKFITKLIGHWSLSHWSFCSNVLRKVNHAAAVSPFIVVPRQYF